MEKHYGYAIVDKDGNPVRSFRDYQVKSAHGTVKFYNEEGATGSPYRVVELFYKDEQS